MNQKREASGRFGEGKADKPARSLKEAPTRPGHGTDWAEESTGVERCPACGQFANNTHQCPPEALREYAVTEDTATEAIYMEAWGAKANLGIMDSHLRYMNGEKTAIRGGTPGPITETISELENRVAEAEAAGEYFIRNPNSSSSVRDIKDYLSKRADKAGELAALNNQLDAADKRYQRFKWTRAFLVVGTGNGHVHSSMGCSTCYPTTEYNWLPRYSGSDETQIVEDAGERACTVCYPTAPVDILNRPTKIYSADEQRKAEERAAKEIDRENKKAEKAAKAATKDGSPLVVVTERGINPAHMRNAGQPYTRTEEFKTERAAYIWMTDTIMWAEWRQANPGNSDSNGLKDVERDAINTIIASLADKHEVDETVIRAELDKKVAAKRKRG